MVKNKAVITANQYNALPAPLGIRVAAIDPIKASGSRIGASPDSLLIPVKPNTSINDIKSMIGNWSSLRFRPSLPSIHIDQNTKIQVGHVNQGNIDNGYAKSSSDGDLKR